ncbi:hypothetical protein JTE90_023774 [Oedothorax gibbosus]|uniref:Major facilitator superfamily associated domain-containing protein n=1 Tax=Oedothorax gibbosus TaxID=931172 RepID=A0AAV6UQZ2_9ARAC|nr:hypothetical protein JTE90_023774 [Oedothorax gibbosus]
MDAQMTEKEPRKSSVMEKFKRCSISINRPLIPLKLALFCFYGIGGFATSFTTLLLKQRGVTLSELSAMTIFAPIMQILGTSVSGVVSDKIGRSKPVLATNLLLVTIITTGILQMPKIDHKVEIHTLRTNSCYPEDIRNANLETSCDFIGISEERNFSMFCSGNLTSVGNKKNQLSCENYMSGSFDDSLSFMISLTTNSYLKKINGKCFYSIDAVNYEENVKLCLDVSDIRCVKCCSSNTSEQKCFDDKSSSSGLLMAYAVLYVLFLTTYSSTFRCFDMTVMFLAKEYNSDFGHERFFAILGNLCWPPIAGLIAYATTGEGEEKNYCAPMYLYIGVCLFLQLIIYKLPVVLCTPGDKMWKKSLKLLKKIDVLMFMIVIFTLGTLFNFTRYFCLWYLDELNASSLLIGIIPSISAVYGLPFLLTSNWWLKKLGTHQIFILALLAYVFCALGYSVLKNPWLALALELHSIFTYYLLWVAVIEHSHSIAPEGLTSTVIAISGAVHYNAGKTTSGLIGGIVMSEFGGIMAFRLLAIICFSVFVLYTLFFILRRKHISKKHHIDQNGGSKENVKACVIFTLEDKKGSNIYK